MARTVATYRQLGLIETRPWQRGKVLRYRYVRASVLKIAYQMQGSSATVRLSGASDPTTFPLRPPHRIAPRRCLLRSSSFVSFAAHQLPIVFLWSGCSQAERKGDNIMTTLRVLAAVGLVVAIMGIAMLVVLGRAVVRGVQWAGTPARRQLSSARPCLAVVERRPWRS